MAAVFPVTCTELGDKIGGTTNNTRGIMMGVIERQLCLYCLLGDQRIETIPPNSSAIPANNKNNS